MIERALIPVILKRMKAGKVVVLTGARRVGKTILVQEVLKGVKNSIYLNAEDMDVQKVLAGRSSSVYKRLISGYEMVVIDEAQALDEAGKVLKLMADTFPGIKFIATGSSAFDIRNKTGEPLTGRSMNFHLFPIAQAELKTRENILETRQALPDRLIFGSYPEVFQYDNADEKEDYLRELVNAYLLKDILVYEQIRNSAKMLDLLKLVAYQIGKDVSYDELGKQLGMSKNTVEKYLDLLTKVFVLFRLGGYSNNLRKEVRKSSRWYFYDTGIRNAIIGDFRMLPLRQDAGELWENYLVSERIKHNAYRLKKVNYYFWRTYDQQEIDLVEEEKKQLRAWEIKWGEKAAKKPKAFSQAYPDASFTTINQNNYLEWIE